MPVFEVLILELPTKKEAEEGRQEKIIVDKKLVCRDEQSAGLMAILSEREKLAGLDTDRVQVLIRPFGK